MKKFPFELKRLVFIYSLNPEDLRLVSKDFYSISKMDSTKAHWILQKVGKERALDKPTLKNHPLITNGRVLSILVKNNSNFSVDDYFSLRFSASMGYMESVEMIVKRGADVNAMRNHALHLACYNGQYEVVLLLTKHGANIHSMQNYCLRWACYQGHVDIVNFLISQGANVNALDNHALFLSTYQYVKQKDEKYLQVIKKLLQNGADADVIDSLRERDYKVPFVI
eukprot:NODE_30_length_37342_cov_0.449507.p20 type:complete len:225 gc:universal NODE_30_length_37342_cov_0.449507:19180-18506(-)